MSIEPASPAPPANASSVEVARLEPRIAKAAIDSEAWRASGQQERYLDSFLMMEAPEAQLAGVHAGIAAALVHDGDAR